MADSVSNIPLHHDDGDGHREHDHPEAGFWRQYIFSTDHKVIGIQYGLTALCFMLFGFFLMLLIAGVKAFLVAGYFMHLISERKMIYLVMGFTAFFFAGLMGLTIWSLSPNSLVHIQHVS